MARVVAVRDAGDERLADYRSLVDSDLHGRRERREREAGVFVAEGVPLVQRLLRSRYPVRSLLVTPAALARLEEHLAGVAAPVYVAEAPLLERVAGFRFHRGALALGARVEPRAVADVTSQARTLAVLEGTGDHENIGAVFRNAAALGVEGVLLSPTCCDPLYRRALRVSMGHVLHVPFARADAWPDALDDVRNAGFTLLALTPGHAALPVDEVVRAPDERVALLLGSEGTGLSGAALARAERRVRIPMAPGCDSLNVATAAAIAFHCLRRR